ncbi:MAG TPA: replicative DNA helicase [Porphyromonadaceae bacterium]|nr:replicative DNA helicase [Porphyromonadaceae bacterium]
MNTERLKPIYNKRGTLPIKEAFFGRVQPQDTEIEAAVLGALMMEKDAYMQVSDTLKAEMFYNETNRMVFEAIQHLATNQLPIDLLTVTNQLKKDGNLEKVGGAYGVSKYTSGVYSASNVEYHSLIIAQKYMARELIRFGAEVQTKAFDETIDVEVLMQEAEAEMFKITQQNVKKEVVQINPVIDELVRKVSSKENFTDGYSGLPSGFTELDKITSGWQPSDLIIIAARPAMGKTAFVLSMAKNIALNYGKGIGIFSLEMPNIQLVSRLAINVTELPAEKLKNSKLEPYELEMLCELIKPLYDAPIYVDDTPALSIFELRSKARRLVREHDVKLICIDYLQLMTGGGGNYGSREQEVSLISRSLKGLAKELNIPIIALSQMNRGVETREGKRPQLSDLRESGAIEQDADIVCFLHRPEYYKIMEDEDHRSTEGIAEVIVAKHRNGSTGEIRLRFKKDAAKFMNENDYVPIQQGRTYDSKINQNIPPKSSPNIPNETSNDDPFQDTGGSTEVPF